MTRDEHSISAVHDIATRQGGCLTRAQVLQAGLTDRFVDAQIHGQRWDRVHPGVYVTHTGDLTFRARVWAAVLHAGPGSAATGPTALRLFGLPLHGTEDTIWVAVDHGRRIAPAEGVVVRRRRNLASVVHPVRQPPVVRAEEAVLQTSAGARRIDAGLAVVADACQQGLTSPARLREALREMPRLPGRQALASVLDDVAGGAQSFLELQYLRRVERAHQLPTAVRQLGSEAGRIRIWRDATYADYSLVVELDGRLGHEWAIDRLRDRVRDADALGKGLATIRIGYPEVLQPCRTALLISAALTSRGWAGSPRRCGPACDLREPQNVGVWGRSSTS
jgi:hypothetical protein